MIQNTTPANQPAQPNPMARPNQEEDFIRIQDLLYLCRHSGVGSSSHWL